MATTILSNIEEIIVVDRMEALPGLLYSDITQIYYSHRIKNSFEILVVAKKDSNGTSKPHRLVDVYILKIFILDDNAYIVFRDSLPGIMKILGDDVSQQEAYEKFIYQCLLYCDLVFNENFDSYFLRDKL